jgi:hypothetical protein
MLCPAHSTVTACCDYSGDSQRSAWAAKRHTLLLWAISCADVEESVSLWPRPVEYVGSDPYP